MIIKRLFILLLFIPQFAFSEYYVKDNNIYNDGNKAVSYTHLRAHET